MTTEIQDEITRFIIEEVLDEDGDTALDPDQHLLTGLLDSFGLMSLLSFIEERYDVTIPNNEVVTDNFKSVAVLAAFVTAKKQASSN